MGADMSSERGFNLELGFNRSGDELREGDSGSGGGLRLGGLLAAGGTGFDCSGEPIESVRGLRLCCLDTCSRWPEFDDLGISGAFVRSAGHLYDESRRKGDVAVPSIASSTMLTRTSWSFTTTGAASAKSMMESIKRIRASILNGRIFVGYVAWIRRGDSECSMKSKRRDTVPKKHKAGYKPEQVRD